MNNLQEKSEFFHELRHTFATYSAESGILFNVPQKLMGHKDIKLTLKYYVEISDEEESRILESMENLHQEINQSERHEQNKIYAKKNKKFYCSSFSVLFMILSKLLKMLKACKPRQLQALNLVNNTGLEPATSCM